MGTSCKKPSRANTKRAEEFVANVLVHIHSDMNVILKDPAILPDLNQELQANNESLVRRFEYDQRHGNVKVYVSSYKIRKLFGAPAEAIWRKLFVRLNKGGRSWITGQSYESCWVLNRDAERNFLFAKLRRIGEEGITPAELLQALDDIDEMVVAATDYAIQVDWLGFEHVQGVEKRVMTRDDHRGVLEMSKELRTEVKAYNSRRFQAMRDQQTFAPDFVDRRAPGTT